MVGTQQTQISRWETGKAKPPEDALNRLRKLLQEGENLMLSGVHGHAPAARRRTGTRRSTAAQIEQYVHLLGAVPDYVVAEKASVSVRTIVSYRARNNIRAYKRPRKGDATVTTLPTSAATPMTMSVVAPAIPIMTRPTAVVVHHLNHPAYAWRVALDHQEGEVHKFLVAANITAAAKVVQATVGNTRQVRSITCLGEALA
jgi:hypothetical protein